MLEIYLFFTLGFLKLKAKAQEKKNLQEESECCNVLGNEYLKLGKCLCFLNFVLTP